METKIESLLATFTLIVLITILGMITSNVMGQELFLQPIGASLQQTSRHLEDFPQFHQTIVPNGLQIGCDGFSASYQFRVTACKAYKWSVTITTPRRLWRAWK